MLRGVWTYVGCAVRCANRRTHIGQSNVVEYEGSVERTGILRELYECGDIRDCCVNDVLGRRALRTSVSSADHDSEANLSEF